MRPDAHEQAFLALQRLLLVINPDFGEGRWQWTHSIRALPPGHLAPGNWYRGASRGFIHVDTSLNGEYVRDLPAGVDPASVVTIPPVHHATILDTMNSLLPSIDAAQRPQFQTAFNNLQKLAGPGHAQRHAMNVQHHALAAVMASPKTLLTFLGKSADFHYSKGMRQGEACCLEAAAFLLLHALATEIASHPEAPTVFRLIPDSGVQSVEDVAARFVRDCLTHGIDTPVSAVLAKLQAEGNGLVEGARGGHAPLGHPEAALDLYYFGLLAAAPYLRAAMVGYEVAAANPLATGKEQRLYRTRANAAEEKLARVTDAILYAVRDLDGSETRARRAAVQAALAAGDRQKAEEMVMETIDLKLFLPKPGKQYLLGA